jgi:hypothetical protein
MDCTAGCTTVDRHGPGCAGVDCPGCLARPTVGPRTICPGCIADIDAAITAVRDAAPRIHDSRAGVRRGAASSWAPCVDAPIPIDPAAVDDLDDAVVGIMAVALLAAAWLGSRPPMAGVHLAPRSGGAVRVVGAKPGRGSDVVGALAVWTLPRLDHAAHAARAGVTALTVVPALRRIARRWPECEPGPRVWAPCPGCGQMRLRSVDASDGAPLTCEACGWSGDARLRRALAEGALSALGAA